MKFTLLSDLHGYLPADDEMPNSDVILIAGDKPV